MWGSGNDAENFNAPQTAAGQEVIVVTVASNGWPCESVEWLLLTGELSAWRCGISWYGYILNTHSVVLKI